VSPTATTQYIVSVTDIWSCQAADTVVVNVFQVFANAGSDKDICSGRSTLLTATGGTSYAWSTGQNTDAITVSPVISSNYIVTVTGVNNCTDVDTVSVIVHAIPNANAGSDQDICIGNTVTLTATGGVSYAWNSGQNTGAITVSPALNTEYIVTVTDVFGCENSDTVNVVVHALPSANAGSDVNICFGESASLSASGGTVYVWNSGQNTADITVSPTATTQYIVSVTDIWSCQAADTVVVNVFQVFANAGSDVDICIGSSTLLTATGGTSYEWSTGPTTDAITVSPIANTNYIVTVTGVNACTDFDTVFVAVNSSPAVSAVPSGIDIRCQNNDTISYSINPISGADTYTWIISPVASGTINGTNENSIVSWNDSFTGTTDVFVIIENECGRDTSAILVVQTNPAPYPNLGNDTTICSGNSIFLDAGIADSYAWSDGFSQQIHEVSTQGQIIVETMLGACSNSDTIFVYISNPVVEFGTDSIFSSSPVTLDAGTGFTEYLWGDASTGQTLLVSDPGWYYVTVTNVFGCTATDSVYVDISTGVDDISQSEFSVYPNPVTEKLVLKISPARQEYFEIELVSVEGVMLESRHLECSAIAFETFDFSNYSPGVYFLAIKSNNGMRQFKIVR
jgi:predicted transcriptional regulator